MYNPAILPNYIISLLPQYLRPPELTGLWVKVRNHHQKSDETLWSRGELIMWQMRNIIFQLLWGHGNWEDHSLWGRAKDHKGQMSEQTRAKYKKQ